MFIRYFQVFLDTRSTMRKVTEVFSYSAHVVLINGSSSV